MKKKKWLARTALFTVFILIINMTMPLKALAFEDYYVSADNSFSIVIKQSKASSSATVKYGTNTWYLFPKPIEAADYDTVNKVNYPNYSGTKIDASFYNACGVSLKGAVQTTKHEDSVYRWDTFTYTAEQFMDAMKKWIAAGTLSRDQLKDGVTLYASRSLNIKKNDNIIGTVYSYPEMEDFSAKKYINWGDNTWNTFYRYTYDQEVTVRFASVGFSVSVVDENGDAVIAQYDSDFAEFPYSDIYYGEKITNLNYPGEIKGYKYDGYKITAGGSTIASSTGQKVNFTANYSQIGENDVELVFTYTKNPEPTEPPFVDIPGEDETPPPTPVPTTPPVKPPVSYNINQSYVRHYSTDAGNWLGKYAKSTSDYVASFEGVTNNGTLNAITSRTSTYQVGTDASGNKWYFFADGTNATYVHPHTYNGYVAESADVKYITELVFPSTITYNGTTYTVTHIGGGTDKYAPDSSDSTSAGYLYESYSYSKHYAEDYYSFSQTTSSTNIYKYHYVKMKYGILGNGEITSNACNNTTYSSGGVITSQQLKDFNNSYIFYNTTLKSVTIPSTVKTIEMYAFQYCQALETIKGGDGITDIKFSAFLVDDKPTLSSSTTWTDAGNQCYIYYYYNGDYSLSSPTSVMNAWQKASILAPAMNFPYMKSLKTIAPMAFSYHYNLSDVDLPATITTIGEDAFLDCKLDNIRIPNTTCSIFDEAGSSEYFTTLGSKGRVENPTAIHTVPDSTAMNYGLKYDGYYRLYCGYPVTYYPNGGTPNSPIEIYSALNINYLEGAEPREYANFTQSNSDSYSWYSEDYQYASYLDDDGVLYRIDLLNSRANVVSPGTTFTELIPVSNSYAGGVSHYAWDSSGNLWFSGQYSWRAVDSSDEWYSKYSGMYDWRKVTLPANTVDVQLDERGVFALDSSGYVYFITPYNSTTRQFNKNGDILFKKFYVSTYNGSTDYDCDSIMIGITTDGRFVYSREDGYYGFCLETYSWSTRYVMAADDFAENTSMTSAFSGKNITSIHKIDSGIFVFFLETGDMILWNGGSWPYQTSYTTKTGYNIVDMRYLATYYDGGSSNNCYEMKDASGVTYLGIFYGSGSSAYCFMRALGTGVEILDAFDFSPLYGNSWATDDWNDTSSYAGITLWTSDGYLTRYKTSSYADGAVKYSSVKFKKIVYNYNNLYGLAEDGTLWSAGNNLYGQLGTSSSYDYEYPSQSDAMTLKKTGTRTYEDIYFRSSYWVIALGTDGNIYYAGEKPTTSYSGSYSDGKKYTFTALGSDYTWPVTSSTPKRYIKGYDYSTEITTGKIFAPPSGKEFVSWNTAAGGTGTTYHPGDKVELSAALSLYAQWSTAEPVYTIIRYDRNGGTGTMANTVKPYDTTSITLDANKFARDGYTFNGWNTKADGTGTAYPNQGSITVSKGSITTLYAQWKKLSPISYTLKYMTYPYGSANNTVWKTKTLVYDDVETVEGQPYTPASGYTVTYNLNKPSGMSTTPTPLSKTSDTIAAPTFNKWRLYRENTNGEYVYAGTQYSQGNTISKLTQKSGEVIYLYPTWNTVGSYVILPFSEATGYVLAGWSEKADGSSTIHPVYSSEDDENIGTFTPSKNTTLYGVWFPLTYDVTLDIQNVTSYTQTNVTMTFDQTPPDITIPTRNQYIFQGYFTGANGTGTQYYKADGTGNGKWTVSDGSVTTLYAYWLPAQNTVTLSQPNATTLGTTSVKATYNAAMPTVTIPKRSYVVTFNANSGSCSTATLTSTYIFGGYYTATNGSGTQYYKADGTSARVWDRTVDTTLHEKWTSVAVTLPTPSRTGYTFNGWYTAASGGTKIGDAGASYTPTAAITLYAQWSAANGSVTLDQQGATTPGTTSVSPTYDADMPAVTIPKRSYVVTFNANGGSCSTTTLTATYTFGGYYTATNGGGTQYYKADGTSARKWDRTAATTLYAKWTSAAVTLPTPTRTGYTFQGWYTAASGGTKIGAAGASYTPTAAITLYAQWSAANGSVTLDQQGATTPGTTSVTATYDADMPAVTIPKKSYVVTFNANGGSCSTTSLTSTYTFGGYYTATNGGGTQYYKADGTSARKWDRTTATTLYAKWTSAAVTLPTPTKTGYDFQGWYTAASGGTKIGDAGASYTPTAAITLYAQWSAANGSVTLDQQGATTPGTTSVTATYDAAMPTVTIPKRSYKVTFDANSGSCSTANLTSTYTFGGYYTGTNGTGTQYYKADGTSARKWDRIAATTLYAKWTSAAVTLPTPTKTGYDFQGWYTAASGGTKIGDAGAAYTPTANITLYAQWKIKTSTVTLDQQGATTPGTTSVTATYDADMPAVTIPKRSYVVTFNANGGSCSKASLTSNYIFGGYYTGTNGTGTQYYKADGTSARKWDPSVTILYAKWTSVAVTLPEPTRTGYTFQGWFDAASGGTKIGAAGAAYTPSANNTLYAQWKANSFTLPLDQQGATTPGTTSVTATYDADMPAVTIPKRSYVVTFNANGGSCSTTTLTSNYAFGGYYTGTNGTGTQYYKADGTSARKWDLPSVTTLYAKWTSAAVTLPTPTKTGYDFQGWYTAASGGTKIGAAGAAYTPTANITLYAQWTASKDTVTLDQQGATTPGTTSVTATYDAAMPAITVPKRSYVVTFNANSGSCSTANLTSTYTFGGFYTETSGGGTQYYKADGASARKWDRTVDTTLYAKWTSAAVTLPTPTKTGYDFQGWYTAASGGTKIGAAGATYTPTAAITLYAQWKAKTSTVTLDQQGATTPGTTSVTATYDAAMPTVTIPKRSYVVTFNANSGSCSTATLTSTYTFGGYYTAANGSGVQYYKSDGTSARKCDFVVDLTLYAKWTSAAVTLPTPTRTGYTFQGWYTAASGGTKIGAAGASYTPTAAITLYAHWSANTYTVTLSQPNATTKGTNSVTATFDAAMPKVTIPKRSYKVTFDANSGSCSTTTLTSNYIFGGYYTGTNGTGTQYYKADGTSARTWNIAKDTTLHEHWTSAAVTLPTPTKTGYDFQGWYTAASGGTKIGDAGAAYTPTAAITLYAQWKAKEYTVTFNANGGTVSPTSKTVTYDSAYGTLPEPSRTGYTFQGWYTTATGGTKIESTTIVKTANNHTLYASWTANKYTVTLSQPNATTKGTTSVTATYDAAMPVITVPKRSYKVTFNANSGSCSTANLTSNYIFGGFFTGLSGTGTQYYKADGTSARTWNIAKDTTLHEHWTSAAVTLPTPTKTGYDFQGWYTAASGGTKIGDAGATYTPTAAITLYAQWKAKEYTVTFDWNFNWDEIGINTNTNWTGNTKTVTYDSAYGTLPAPTREGYEFFGWFTSEDAEGNGDGTQVLETTIVKTASNHTLYAKWSISYMESADVWLKSLRKEEMAVADGELKQLQMLELGDTLLNLTVTTDGFFDYMKITAPWTTPIIVDFDEGTYDKANDIWYLPGEDYIQFFAAGGDPTAVRNNPGYTNENHLVTVDFYRKDGTVLITYKVNVIFIPYDVWKNDVIIGREPTS